MASEAIRRKIALAPQSPGVYLFRDALGQVIYAGKASNLRNRVRSYFGSKSGLSTKTRRLVSEIADLEFLMVSTEQEALVLEADLIKRYRPQYNARMKDDKSFPFLKVDIRNEWPTVAVTRRRVADGSVYFGPFADARSVRKTLRLIRRVFRFRVCSGSLEGKRARPCLNMQIGLCPGPCIGAITREEYRKTIDQIVLFLEGRHREVLASLIAGMKEASTRMDFERAALLRDSVQAVDLITSKYTGIAALRGDQDILAVAQDRDSALVEVFCMRDGRVLGRQDYPVEGTGLLTPPEVLRGFVLQYYVVASRVPPSILLQHSIADGALVRNLLCERRGGGVRLVVPRRGVRKQVVDNVANSVARQLALLQANSGHGLELRGAGLKQLRDVLRLPTVPHRIEGYDISTTQGHEAVGSMVVFEDGVPKPSAYRRFKIRTVSGQDDYSMIREVLRRRLGRLERGPARTRRPATTGGFGSSPSLILVDGGRGQLGAALEARNLWGATRIPIIGLAKEHEYVYSESKPEPVDLPQNSPGLRILQAVRDEAHRFAVTYHRNLRDSTAMASVLDDVPGVGPARRRALLRAFETMEAMGRATAEELAEEAGIPRSVAMAVREQLAAGGA